MRRRALLRGAALAAVGLAGCTDDGSGNGSGGDGSGGSGSPTASPTPTETATDSPTPSPTETATPTESEPTATRAADVEVTVAPDGSLDFDPAGFSISTGDTVLWVWDGAGHNVVADSIPEESDWEGTPGGAGKTYGSGYTYRHTFDVAGEYTYYCAPHRSVGMEGSFTVG